VSLEPLAQALREQALRYPEAYEESPWGERVVKVNDRIFLFSGLMDGVLHLTVRLPHSGFTVLAAPFAKPAGYGLARTGWVSLTLDSARTVSRDELVAWIDESYRAVAPRRLVAGLPPEGPPPATAHRGKLPPVKARVAVASDDPLRCGRAETEFRRVGIQVMALGGPRPELLEGLEADPPAALIVDAGRRTPAGIELARVLLESIPELPIVFAGVRDARMERQLLEQIPGARCIRKPPGDPALVQAVAQAIL
jgi:predicted DNA-binding protein (MmcQ/YjbR family)/CheY-like chemotaxis protein